MQNKATPFASSVRSYGHVAWCYDALASAYSLGAIGRAKAWHHRLIQPGDRVLYVGAGRGREIVGATERGAAVTCVEPCPKMASALRRRRQTNAGQARWKILTQPIQSVTPQASYDFVVAHFFLNVFNQPTMARVLEHLVKHVRPGGRLVIADFEPAEPQASKRNRAIRAAYFRPVNIAGWILRICDLHPIEDYERHLKPLGFDIEHRVTFRSFPLLPRFYSVISAIKTTQ